MFIAARVQIRPSSSVRSETEGRIGGTAWVSLSMPLLTELGFSFLVAASYKPCAPLELSLRKGRLRDLDEITIARQRPDRRKACGQDPVAHIPNATRNWNGN